MIFIPAFTVQGVADFSQIKSELQSLQSIISSLRISPIKTQIEPLNMSPLNSAIATANKQKIKIKPEIDTSFTGGLNSFLGGQKGQFQKVGQELGQTLTMGMQQQFGMIGGMASTAAQALGPIGIAAGAAAAAVGVLGAAAISAAANWQTLMTTVSKTTGVEGAELAKLSSDLQKLRMETGATAESVAGAATTAGSIGIPKEELADFTRISLQMAGAFNMSSDAAAGAMGKIGNVVKPADQSWSEFASKQGSSINALADGMATSEEQILTGMTHLGATMGLLKPPIDTLDDWEAMVATVQSLGLAGDQAGEAIQDALTYAARDAKGNISSLLKVDPAQLQTMLRTDAMGVLQQAAIAVSDLPLEQQAEQLKAFGMTGSKAIQLLMGDLDKTTGEFKELGKAIKLSNDAVEDGSGLSQAFDKTLSTFDNSVDRLKQSLQVAAEGMGSVMLPAATAIVDALNSIVTAASAIGGAISAAGSALNNFFMQNGQVGSAAKLEQAFESKHGGHYEIIAGDSVWIDDAKMSQEEKFAESMQMGEALGGKTGIAYMAGLGKELGSPMAALLSDSIEAAANAAIPAAKEAGSTAGNAFSSDFMERANAGLTAVFDKETGKITGYRSTKGEDEFVKELSSDTFDIFGDQWELQESAKVISDAARISADDVKRDILGPNGEYFKAGEDSAQAIAQAHYDSMKGSIMDTAGFMEMRYGEISDTIGEVMADHMFEPAEKATLEIYDKLLDIYKQEHPVEFEAANLDELQEKLKKAISGPWEAEIAPDLSKFNFSMWLSEGLSSDLYSGVYNLTQQVMTEAMEKPAWEMTTGENITDVEKQAYDLLRSGITSSSLESSQNAWAAREILLQLNSKLLDLDSTKALLAANEVVYKNQYDTAIALGKVVDMRTGIASEALGTNWEDVSSISKPMEQTADGVNALQDGIFETSASTESTSINTAAIDQSANEISNKVESIMTASDDQMDQTTKMVELLGTIGESMATIVEAISTATSSIVSAISAVSINIVNNYGGESASNDVLEYGIFETSSNDYLSGLSNYTTINTNATVGSPISAVTSPYISGIGFVQLAEGGFADQATMGVFGEAGREAFVPISNRQAGLKILPQVMKELGVAQFQTGAFVGDGNTWENVVNDPTSSLFGWGSDTHNAVSGVITLTDNLGNCALSADGLADSCKSTSSGALPTLDTAINDTTKSLLNLTTTAETKATITQTALGESELATAMSIGGGSFSGVTVGGTPGALVTGLSQNGYVVTYDPRNDTCMGIEFNAPDPSLKTSDPFYLGLTYGTGGKSIALTPTDEGGWGGQVAQTLDGRFLDLSSLLQKGTESVTGVGNTISDYIKATNSTVIAIEKTATQQTVLLKDANGKTQQVITNLEGVIQAVKSGTNTMNNTLVEGSLVGGTSSVVSSNTVPAWFAAAAPAYGSTFNDWISGGAAGVGLNPDPSWLTDAISTALETGIATGTALIGSVATSAASSAATAAVLSSSVTSGYTSGSSSAYYSGTTAAMVEATGGSWGGWAPSIGSGGFIEGSGPGILANIAENGGDEYVIPARGVPVLKQKQPTVLNMSFSDTRNQGIIPDLAAGLRTLPHILRNIGNVSVESGFGGSGRAGRGGGMGGISTHINVEGDLSSEVRLHQILDERDRKLIASLKSAQGRSRRGLF